jgi:hypothetical protein
VSVAVTLTLSDGLIVGVDSAVTISFGPGNTNVYEDAEKVFQLGQKRIGIAIFGLAGIGDRSIGSYIREFELKNPNNLMQRECSLKEIVEGLRAFFYDAYSKVVIPLVEQVQDAPFTQVPVAKRPMLGLLVGGYSADAFLPEVWEINIPEHDQPATARLLRSPGVFGLSWHAMYRPIGRYIDGFDSVLMNEFEAEFVKILGRPLSPQELSDFKAILARHQYQFVYSSMPISSGVRFVRHLVNMVIEHYRVVAEDPIVGGEPRLGVVTYKGEQFRIL